MIKKYYGHFAAIFVALSVILSLRGCADDFSNKRESEMVDEGNGLFQQFGEWVADLRDGDDENP